MLRAGSISDIPHAVNIKIRGLHGTVPKKPETDTETHTAAKQSKQWPKGCRGGAGPRTWRPAQELSMSLRINSELAHGKKEIGYQVIF